MLKFAPYSYSKIDCFTQCPQKFKLNYIEKINLFTANKALEKGSRIHEIIEFYQPTYYWKMPQFDYKLLDKEEQTEVEKIAMDFVKSDFGKWYVMHDWAIGHEIHIGMDNKLQPCNYHNKSAMLRGKIDYMIKDKTSLVLVDWKSGKVPNQAYMSNEQLMLYAIWGFNMFPDVDVIRADYVYVEHGEKFTFTFKRENYKNYTKTYANRIKSIETEVDYPKKVNKLCDYCDYKKQGYCDG
jgi:ATP-dependent exoDNAse (exonuclease V) beta subunit